MFSLSEMVNGVNDATGRGDELQQLVAGFLKDPAASRGVREIIEQILQKYDRELTLSDVRIDEAFYNRYLKGDIIHEVVGQSISALLTQSENADMINGRLAG